MSSNINPAQSGKIVPTINSLTVARLGVAHVPRLWQKLILAAAGLLAEGYDACSGEPGYDLMTLTAFNINRDALLAFVNKEKPNLVDFENWIALQPGVNLDTVNIWNHNVAIAGYAHKVADREKIAGRYGDCLSAQTTPHDAPTLNFLDDAFDFHAGLFPKAEVTEVQANNPDGADGGDTTVVQQSAAPAEPVPATGG